MRLSDANQLSNRDAALFYARLGYRVFPLIPNKKVPACKHWKLDATTDPMAIAQWWAANPACNIGLRDTSCLDVDDKDGKEGSRSLAELGWEPASVPIQHTPSGGRHILLRHDLRYRMFQGKGNHGGLDLRTPRDGYIVAAPSMIDGRMYQWEEGDEEPQDPPEEVKRVLLDWSAGVRGPAVEARTVTPEPGIDQRAAEMLLDTMQGDAAWFRTGRGSTGDNSRDAYRGVIQLAREGWTLERLSAVLRYSDPLASLGSEHRSEGDWWAWAWKYTVLPGWEFVETELKTRREILGIPVTPQTEDPLPITYPERDTAESLETLLAEHRIEIETLDDLNRLLLRIAAVPTLSQLQLDVLADRIVKVAAGLKLRATTLKTELKNLRKTVRTEMALGELDAVQHQLFVRGQNKVYDTVTGNYIEVPAFIVGLTRKAACQGLEESEIRTNFLTSLEAENHFPLVESVIWDPRYPPGMIVQGEGEDRRKFWNDWKPAEITGAGLGSLWGRYADQDVKKYLDHVERVDFEEGGWAIDYWCDLMAFLVQHPGIKVDHAALFGGLAGVGKDTLVYPLLIGVGFPGPDRIGQANAKEVSAEELMGNFDSYLAKTRVLVVEEIERAAGTGADGLSVKLKHLTASPPHWLRINEKHQRPYEIPNIVQLIGLTNKRLPFRLDAGDRRWCALWCNRIPLYDPAGTEGIADLWRWMLEERGAEKVVGWLRQRDVSRWNPKARPRRTAWLEEIEGASQLPAGRYIQTQIAEKQGIFALPVLSEGRIFQAMRHCDPLMHRADDAQLIGLLKELGMERRKIDGTVFWRLWGEPETVWQTVKAAGAEGYLNREVEGEAGLVAMMLGT